MGIMIERGKTRMVSVGNVRIGAGYPVSIQSMTKTVTSDIRNTVLQIKELESAGCEIVRLAVKDLNDAKAISEIKKEVSIPLVADIHFDYRLAVKAVENGADKIRINPGNIAQPSHIDMIIDAAAARSIPIRIGVNSGSLPPDTAPGEDKPARMVRAVLDYLGHFEKRKFNDIVVSLKASEVPVTIAAYRKMSQERDYPLHIGVTAAGLPEDGIVRSSIGLGSLLMDGIGDTVRVSLTGGSVLEVEIAKRILTAIGSRNFGPRIISCPTCGRCQVDLVPIVRELERKIVMCSGGIAAGKEKQIVIAVMGCEVNGPGEAREADIGVAFGKGKGAIFRHGRIIKTVDVDSAISELTRMMEEL
ncbi:MAG: flavodoxin-dependent (E)-4-hydroxy-3-methylbut-2-enyl-diphosphate synthase [Candidatus Omnitrophota bacterium]